MIAVLYGQYKKMWPHPRKIATKVLLFLDALVDDKGAQKKFEKNCSHKGTNLHKFIMATV